MVCKGASANGVTHGPFTMFVTSNGQVELEHGKWIVVNQTEADNKTVAAFEDLHGGSGLIDESTALSYVVLLEHIMASDH